MLSSGDKHFRRSGMIAAVTARLLYLIFQQVLGLALRPCGCPKLRARPVTCPFVRGRWPGMIR
jgi:hypothetical protein